jgi:PAS domain S-box-containing protein/putative nucleotidyltransferase with HDIG domain
LGGKPSSRRLIELFMPPALISAVCLAGLAYNYLLFHVLAELGSIIVGIMALVVATAARRFTRNHFALYICIGLGWCAAVDLLHMLSYRGMSLLPVDESNVTSQFWIIARFLQALVMVSAPLFLYRALRVRDAHVAFGLYVAVAVALVVTGYFPDTYVEGEGLTPFKVNAEYLIILILALAAVLITRIRDRLPPLLRICLLAALGFMIVSEFAFTRYISLYGEANAAGHVLKVFAYWFLFVGLVQTALRNPFALMARSAGSYDAVPDPSVVIGADGRIIQANQAALAMTGLTVERIAGADSHQLFHDPRQTRAACPVCSRLMRGERKFMVEIARSDTFLECSVAPFVREAARDAHVEVLRDISARKRLEAERQLLLTDLRERIKELGCLHAIAELSEKPDLDPPALLQGAVAVLPSAFRYPQQMRATIDSEWGTFGAAAAAEHCLEQPLVVAGRKVGLLRVAFAEAAVVEGDPFLPEERALMVTVTGTLGDVLERLQGWTRVQNLSRMYDLLSASNRAIVRCRGIDELLGQLFSALVRHGQFPMLFIARTESGGLPLRLVHQWGMDTAQLHHLEAVLTGSYPPFMAQLDALRRGEIVSADLPGDAPADDWIAYLRSRGIAQRGLLPLRQEGQFRGVIGLYVRGPGNFDAEQLRLLEEMVADVEFALGNFAAAERRQEIEQRAALSEHRFRGIFEHSPLPMQIASISTGEYRAFNQAMQDWLGYTVADVPDTRSWFAAAYDDPGLRSEIQALWQQHLSEAARSDRIFRSPVVQLRRKDGSFATAIATMTVTGDDVIVVWSDLTAVRQQEEALRESEQRFRRMIEQAVGCIYVRRGNRFVYVNPNFCRMLGYARDELLGQDGFAFAVLDEEGQRLLSAEWTKLAEQGGTVRYTVPVRRKDGAVIDLDIQASNIDWEDGQAVIGLAEDVTERRRLEIELRRSHDLLSKLAVQVPGVIYQFRLHPDGRSSFPFASEGIREIYEVSPEEVREDASAVYARLHPDDLARVSASIEDSARTLKTWRADYRVVLPRQGERWRTGTAQPERLADGSVLWHGFITDATERKMAEETLEVHVRQVKAAMKGTLEVVSRMIDLRDPYTAGHERRVGLIAADIARELGWSQERCEGMEMIGMVHDIGKISVPAEILVKPTRLSDTEMRLVQGHAQAGYEILREIAFEQPVAETIRQHHERLDGSGYPRGLKGGDILPEARVLAVADVLESMASHRPYRPALGLDAAIAELEGGRGRLYDPAVVDALLRLVRERGYRLPD